MANIRQQVHDTELLYEENSYRGVVYTLRKKLWNWQVEFKFKKLTPIRPFAEDEYEEAHTTAKIEIDNYLSQRNQ